jgi:micrococcal nuclease
MKNPIKIVKIVVILAVIVVLSFGAVTIFNQYSQLTSETSKLPSFQSPQIPKEPTTTKVESKIEPVQPEPVQPEPVQPEPVQPEPVKTESINCSGDAKCITGKVTAIIDGDTVFVNGQSIRFALISAPELDNSGGIEARNYIKKICPVGSNVIVDEDDGQTTGSYGRTIAEIYCNGVSLNESILAVKLATIYTEFCSKSEFASEPWAKQGCSAENQVTSPQIPKEIPKSSSYDKKCDPAYPDVCIAQYPPDLDCKQIQYTNFRVLSPDPHNFDVDKDGIGCEDK